MKLNVTLDLVADEGEVFSPEVVALAGSYQLPSTGLKVTVNGPDELIDRLSTMFEEFAAALRGREVST